MSEIAFDLDVATQARLEKIASSLQQRPEAVVQEALSIFLDMEERREQFRQDTLASWEHYQTTGLHLTGDEVNEWLERRANGEHVRLPVCHT